MLMLTERISNMPRYSFATSYRVIVTNHSAFDAAYNLAKAIIVFHQRCRNMSTFTVSILFLQ